jgi:hypothetical protein
LPQVAEESHSVVREGKAAGIWLFGGGIFEDRPSVVEENEEQAYVWAAKIAKSCRCPQEVREMIYDTESVN